jgi:hypothetical protein
MIPLFCPLAYCTDGQGGYMMCLSTRTCSEWRVWAAERGQTLAIAEVAAAADVIKISIVPRAPFSAACDELTFGACETPEVSSFFYGRPETPNPRMGCAGVQSNRNAVLTTRTCVERLSMTIPRTPSRKQAHGPNIALRVPANDEAVVPPGCPDGLGVCPTCGRPYFGPASSGLLDLVVSAHAAIADVKAALEAVVMR